MIARFAIPFFLFMGLVVVPVFVALLCRWLLPRKMRWWGTGASTLLIWALVAYGSWGVYEQLEVHRIEVVSADLPEAFDGYRIVQFSDAHVGTMTGSRHWLMQRAVDSINAQRADAIVFTGDLQNVYPSELQEHVSVMKKLHARDGVFSVLGNHDYAVYQSCDDTEKALNCRKTIAAERAAGWQVLLNEHRIIRRDSDFIVIAGMENWGKQQRMPRNGDVTKTLAGLRMTSDSLAGADGSAGHAPFIVMLQHDPNAWREKILPACHAQLTLSGHTHGGQVSLFGWSPAALSYDDWGGTYVEDSRILHVSTGLGALIPFRLGLPGEIVVITLKRKK